MVHVLNTVNRSIVFILRLVLEFNAFHKRADNIVANSLDVKNVTGTNVPVVDFFFMQKVDAVHEVDKDFEFFLCGPWPFG